MKTSKAPFVKLLIPVVSIPMILMGNLADGQVPPPHRPHPHAQVVKPRPMRVRSNKYLHRTAFVIKKAQIEVRNGKVRTGKFARSVALQRHARALWNRKNYRSAVHYSHRARVLAIMAIKENNGKIEPGWKTAEDEKDMLTDAPNDTELDKSTAGVGKDEDLINGDLNDIDVQDVDEGDYK